QRVQYTITRWEYNPQMDTLDIDVNFKKDGKLFHTYHIAPLYEGDSTAFFVKSLPAFTLFTIPDKISDAEEWVIHCDPAFAESVDGSGYKNGGAIIFGDGESVYFNRATGMTIYYKYDLEPFFLDDDAKRPVFANMKSKKTVTKCEWDADTHKFVFEVNGKRIKTAELDDTSGQDNYVNVNFDPQTQFTIPYGWFIDCDKGAIKEISGKGESLNNGGGWRYYEGATILFNHKSGSTIRQLYRP
ncbi:MAG: hypothetical protein IJS40_07690, partial [Synergistaceae bacterium]|nr:hypothetical protein [Synergistaceae bacterium]